jgi:hypothetical protein
MSHMNILLQDIAYALRQLRKSPSFATVAILTLALGIGANTSLFSIVNGVLLNRLPYPHPERLVTLSESKANFEYGSISYPNFRDWQKDNHSFSSMAIYRSSGFSLTGSGEAEQVNGEFVSSDLFLLLGVKPVIGRSLAADEDQMGAGRMDILRLIIGSSGGLTLMGIGGGLTAAVGLTRLMAGMLYGVSASDPLTLAAVCLILTFVALLASYIPARHAAKVDPMVALSVRVKEEL